MGRGALMRNMDGAKENDGLCERNRERVGHDERGNFIVHSGDYIGRREEAFGSDLIGLSGVPTRRGGVSGAVLGPPLFLGLPFPACALARPQDSSGSDSFVHPTPPLPLLPFLLPLSNYLLVSSPAGRSFFEKTTRARTRPTPLSKISDLSPIPTGDTRPHSYVFPLAFSTHLISLHERLFLFSPSIYYLYPRHVPNPLPFPVLFIPAYISLRRCIRFLPIPSELTSTCFSHPILSLQNRSSSFLALLTFFC